MCYRSVCGHKTSTKLMSASQQKTINFQVCLSSCSFGLPLARAAFASYSIPIALLPHIRVIFPLGSITIGTSNVHLLPLSNTIHRRLVCALIHTSSLHYDIFWQGHLPKHQSRTVWCSGTRTPRTEYPSPSVITEGDLTPELWAPRVAAV